MPSLIEKENKKIQNPRMGPPSQSRASPQDSTTPRCRRLPLAGFGDESSSAAGSALVRRRRLPCLSSRLLAKRCDSAPMCRVASPRRPTPRRIPHRRWIPHPCRHHHLFHCPDRANADEGHGAARWHYGGPLAAGGDVEEGP